MTAKELILERKKPVPNWANLRGVYADLSDWPGRISFYAKCPKCGHVHGDFKTMREAHAKRLCPDCDIKAINKLKDYIAQVDDPDQRGKPGKSIAKMFHEAQDPDDIDPMEMIDKTIIDNWMVLAMFQLQTKEDTAFTLARGADTEDADTTVTFDVEGDDGTEWTIYKTEDDAYNAAIERVREDLDDQPELFTPDWLEGFINMERLKRDLLMDKDWRDDFVNMYGDEDEQVDYLIDQGLLSEDDFFTPTGKRRKMSPKRERLLEQGIEAWGEKQAEDFDPMEYMRDIYGRDEAAKEAIKIAGIDRDAAATEAVDVDGWAHFLAHYDGNYTELKNGAVAFRTN